MNKNLASWICCQLGAREHYAIPRVLHSRGRLNYFITDAWVADSYTLKVLPNSILTNLRERYHPELKTATVKAFNHSLITWELKQRYKNIQGWDKIIARNSWWQKKVLKILNNQENLTKNTILFAYSYTALELFKFAKSQGWKTILGQIDPGLIEEKLILEETQKYPQFRSSLKLAPEEYWNNWRQECTLADQIIVNSTWSKDALQKTGVSQDKMTIIPLAYQPSLEAKQFQRTYPQNFSQQRPLKVLFLGQVILRKGVASIIEAIDILDNKPLEFWFVGAIGIDLPKSIKNNPKIKWLGAVSRSTTNYYYQQADIFLFPTISDGFGLTQLEAQAWQLPIITSQFCGEVVKDKINGLILPNVTGKAISRALNFCLDNPQELAHFSQKSHQVLPDFNLEQLAQKIQLLDST